MMRKRQQTSRNDIPLLDVVIEIPRGSFMKRGSSGRLDFISPFPCPFNYGSVEGYLGLEGDLLDAVVLGPRLQRGVRVNVRALGAIGLTDRGMYDDKLICSDTALDRWQRILILLFSGYTPAVKERSMYTADAPAVMPARVGVMHGKL